MMNTISPRTKGFTIVELIIVIAVIAILAVITFVGYGWVTTKARSTSNLAEVKNYITAFTSYRIDHGAYPYFGGATNVGYCVGKGYPTNYDGDAYGDCINDYDFSGFNYNESDAFNALIQPYIKALPTIQKDGFMAGGHRFNGLNYMYDPNISIDGVWEKRAILFYYLQGSGQDCQVKVLKYTGTGTGYNGANPGGSDYVFSSDNENNYTYTNSYATGCMYALPNR